MVPKPKAEFLTTVGNNSAVK
jgi:hypothetical protein